MADYRTTADSRSSYVGLSNPRRKQQRQQYRPSEPIAGKQPRLPSTTQHQEPHQPNQFPTYDGWHAPLAFPGYHFDPFTADPIPPATANDIKGIVHALTALPRFLYFSVLLFLPFFYRKPVHRIFNGVHLTENEMASRYIGGPPAGSWRPKHWEEVKSSWSDFIDSTLKEWSTLNIVSVLLLSAIYNLLQLGGSGSHLVQSTALMSLISALTSLFFGCLYVTRFEAMRRPHKAMQLAQSAPHSSHNTWWNFFVLLSLPFVWLAWSIVLFIICLMSVIWQASSQQASGQPTNTNCLHIPLSLGVEIDVKIITSAFLFIAFLHLCLILITFSQYSDIEEEWSERIKHMIQAAALVHGPVAGVPGPPTSGPHRSPQPPMADMPSLLPGYPPGAYIPSSMPPPVQVTYHLASAVTEETSMDSETRLSPARHRHERRGPDRRGRHRHRHSEDSSEESEPKPSASRHKDKPTQARHYRSEDSSEESRRRRPRRTAAVHRSPSIYVEAPRRPSRPDNESRSPGIPVVPPRRPSSPSPIEYYQVVQSSQWTSPRISVEVPSLPSSPAPPVVQFPSTPPSPTTADQIPAPSESSTTQHNQTQRAGSTSWYRRGGSGNQNNAELQQSVAPRSRRDTSDNVSSFESMSSTPVVQLPYPHVLSNVTEETPISPLESVSSTLQLEHSPNRGE